MKTLEIGSTVKVIKIGETFPDWREAATRMQLRNWKSQALPNEYEIYIICGQTKDEYNGQLVYGIEEASERCSYVIHPNGLKLVETPYLDLDKNITTEIIPIQTFDPNNLSL